MGRILVTGAAGFIGSHLVDRLLELGKDVVGVDGFTEYYPREYKLRNLERARQEARFELVEGELGELDPGALLQDVNVVVHLAAEPGVRASWGENFSRYIRRNVEVTQRLLEAIPERGFENFVFASSSSIYGSAAGEPLSEEAPRRPASPYGLSKLTAEELVGLYTRERDVPATILRYFTVYGPRQRPEMALSRFIGSAIRGRELEVYGDGEQEREMTYVSDVVDATVSAVEAPPGGTYNVGGGTRATVNELTEIVGQQLGRPLKVTYGPAAEGDVRSTWADIGRAERDLGYRPRVGLADGIAAQVNWALHGEPAWRR